MKSLIVVFILLALTGCAHDYLAEPGSLNADQELIVDVGSEEVKEGDVLEAFRVDCYYHDLPVKGRSKICRRIEAGQATVVEVLDTDRSKVRSPSGYQLKEDMHFRKLEK